MGGRLTRIAAIERLQLMQEKNVAEKWEDNDPTFQDIKTANLVPAVFEAYETSGTFLILVQVVATCKDLRLGLVGVCAGVCFVY